jgi:hypothetical protein
LLALSAFSQLVSLAPLPGMSTWRDEQYSWISLATLTVFVVLVARFAFAAPAVSATRRARIGRAGPPAAQRRDGAGG